MASFAEPDSPFNKVVGLGFDGVPSAAELDVIEKAFADQGAPTQVELAHLAESAIGELLSDRGYRLESFENVLGLALDGDQERVTPPGIEVRRSTADELDAWIAVVADASTYPDTQGLPWHDEFPREAIENAERDFAAAGGIRYAAFRDGVLAGGADFRITDGIAQLAGAATAPAHRRHGVQSALVAARLADANGRGVRRRRDRHPAGLQVAGERATPGLRPALHPRDAGEALTTAPTHAVRGRRTLRAVCADPARCAWAHRRRRNASSRVSTAWSESVSVTCSAGTRRNAAPVARIWRR